MSLAAGDLTTVANVQAYAASPPSATVLASLVGRLSRMIQSVLSRPLLVPRQYIEQYDGTNTTQLVLANYPLLDVPVPSLIVSGQAFAIAPQANAAPPYPNLPWGYRYQPWNGIPPGNPAVLQTVGGASFWGGKQNVVLTYWAGYQVTGEAASVPGSPGPYTYLPVAPYGIWATDRGVSYATTGIALTAISSGTPTVGQYLPPKPDALSSPTLNYTFAAADAGQALLISYGFIPADVEQACIDLILERASYRSRIGLRSQFLAGQETMNYDVSGMTDFIKRELQEYVNVIPPNIGALV